VFSGEFEEVKCLKGKRQNIKKMVLPGGLLESECCIGCCMLVFGCLFIHGSSF